MDAQPAALPTREAILEQARQILAVGQPRSAKQIAAALAGAAVVQS